MGTGAHNWSVEALAMASRKTRGANRIISVRELIDKLRKPLAPPTQAYPDERKYRRSRERERLRQMADRDVPAPDKSNVSD